jgi:hypothetical protein
MNSAEIWLEHLISSGGDRAAPLPTVIPPHYLPKPRRQPLQTIDAPSLKRPNDIDNHDPGTPLPASPIKKRRLTEDPNSTTIPTQRQRDVIAGIAVPVRISGRQTTDEGYAESYSSSTNILSKTSSGSSQSLTKRMIDLRVADKGIVHKPMTQTACLPEKAKMLHRRVQETAEMPVGIIPGELKVGPEPSHCMPS